VNPFGNEDEDISAVDSTNLGDDCVTNRWRRIVKSCSNDRPGVGEDFNDLERSLEPGVPVNERKAVDPSTGRDGRVGQRVIARPASLAAVVLRWKQNRPARRAVHNTQGHCTVTLDEEHRGAHDSSFFEKMFA
jgi:hypothetical protein